MHIIDIITMGCSKNLVDSEQLLNQFREHGFTAYHNPKSTHGDIAIVNTCGFIADAKEENINMILKLCDLKGKKRLKHVFVMGCLSERYLSELQEEIPQVDKFYGKFNWKEILFDLSSQYNKATLSNRVLTTPGHFAYLKISEGCDRQCAYCAIPIITGNHVSRPIEEILTEVEALVQKGVKEFQVIAQELTYYGTDLYHEQRIAELIERMAMIKGVEWIRLHYAYPTNFPLSLLRVMREYDNVCNYIDIAFQHISDHILSRMRRHITKQETIELISTIRREVPGICIRTTLMTGFPGETQEDFDELMDFVRETRFDRMGAFAYSEEEGTYAAIHYKDDIPEYVKNKRLDTLMSLQENISAELSAEKIGKEFRTIIDRREGDFYIGRTEYDSPDVDCEVLIKAHEISPLSIGNFYKVKITGCEEFDLYGQIVKS